MFSSLNISKICESLLLKPLFIKSFGFQPSYSIDPNNFCLLENYGSNFNVNGECVWWHEEPLDFNIFDSINYKTCFFPPYMHAGNLEWLPNLANVPDMCCFMQSTNFHLLANSEKSNVKRQILKKYHHYDWYFFYHGIAALDWFRDFKYLTMPNIKISKVFITLNHLLTKKRSYRLSFLAKLAANNLNNYGYISAPLLSKELVKQELFNKNSFVSKEMKKQIFKHLLPNASPKKLDEGLNYLDASASIIDFKFSLSSLWHVVTETIFYEDKLHLTEKIFKPIVLKRPFILVGASGNLDYLRNYGFKTFDKWIDESYDNEKDPDLRLQKIIVEIEKLCAMPNYKLIEMHNEMNDILEYNHNHFFTNFKNIVIDELVDNLHKAILLYNNNKSDRFKLPVSNINFENVKLLLKS